MKSILAEAMKKSVYADNIKKVDVDSDFTAKHEWEFAVLINIK